MERKEFLQGRISSINEARTLEGKLALAPTEDQAKELNLLCDRLVRLVELECDNLGCSISYSEDETKRIVGDVNRIIHGKPLRTLFLDSNLADGIVALINAFLKGIENGDLEPNDADTLNEWQRKTAHLDLIAALFTDGQTGNYSLFFRDVATYPYGQLNPNYVRLG